MTTARFLIRPSSNLVLRTCCGKSQKRYLRTPSSPSCDEEEKRLRAKNPGDVPKEAEPQQKPMSITDRDAMLMNAWKDREGSLANSQFEDGKVEEGYRRHVKANIFRYI